MLCCLSLCLLCFICFVRRVEDAAVVGFQIRFFSSSPTIKYFPFLINFVVAIAIVVSIASNVQYLSSLFNEPTSEVEGCSVTTYLYAYNYWLFTWFIVADFTCIAFWRCGLFHRGCCAWYTSVAHDTPPRYYFRLQDRHQRNICRHCYT